MKIVATSLTLDPFEARDGEAHRMSLWLQTAIEALQCGDYGQVRRNLLPVAPIRLPDCLLRELEFAERCCSEAGPDRLFPIRFIWLLEGNEQRLFGYPPLARSRYHPETTLDVWERVSRDASFRQKLEGDGFRFDFVERALEVTAGWIYVGEQFAEDLFAIEAALGIELLFPRPPAKGERRPAFLARRTQGAACDPK